MRQGYVVVLHVEGGSHCLLASDCSQVVDLVSRFSDSVRRMLENSRPRNLKFFVKDIYKKFFLSLEDT